MSIEASSDVVSQQGTCPQTRRDTLFRETMLERLRRWGLGTAWALKPGRIGDLPALAQLCLTELTESEPGLPDPNSALTAMGHCGIVRDLSVPTLLAAYRRGLFPFAHFGPLKWMSPEQRCVLFVDKFHLRKNTRRLLRLGRFRVTFDRDFDGVVKACAEPRQGRLHLTWITPRIMRAYADLYDAGYAHSCEVWNESGELIGGSYGLAIGCAFFGESQFSRERQASQIGFAMLNWHLIKHGFVFNDGKWPSPLLHNVGFRPIPRAEFLAHLAKATSLPGWPGHWQVETDLATIADWHPGQRFHLEAPKLEHALTAAG